MLKKKNIIADESCIDSWSRDGKRRPSKNELVKTRLIDVNHKKQIVRIDQGLKYNSENIALYKTVLHKITDEFDAIVVRLKRSWRRNTGERICFSDNAVALLKDEKGNPKGTQIKGPIAREVQERWKEVARIASIVH